MDGEQETIAEVDAETPIEKADEPYDPGKPEGAEPEGNEETGEETGDDDGLDDLEWEGVKARVPRELKSQLEERLGHFSKHFTTKTQETAALRKELEQGRESLAQQFNATDEELQARGRLAAIKEQLDQYAQVDWEQLEAADPVGSPQHWRRFQMMKEQAGAIAQELNHRAQERSQSAQQETAKRFEATQDWVKNNIKGWTPETDAQVLEWAKSKGATNQNLLDAMSPMVYEMLHLARLGEQALTKKPTASKPTPITEPLKVIASKANPPARKNLSDMSMDEYAADFHKRQKQGR